MNTAAKMVLGVAVVGVVVVGYVTWQSGSQPGGSSVEGGGVAGGAGDRLRPSTRLLDLGADGTAGIGAGGSGASGMLGPGERPWMVQFDERGEVSYRFRADRLDPEDAGTVRVVQPAFEFFLTDGQIVQVSGQTGRVYFPAGALRPRGMGSKSAGAGKSGLTMSVTGNGTGNPGGAPTRGTMKDVKISIFENENAVLMGKPAVEAEMDNVAFDNDTLRIATEGFTTSDGKEIAAEKVPVIVRGSEYDFDGEGLVIRLSNERDRAFQSLEIARGTRLVIKNPDRMNLEVGGGSRTSGPEALAARAEVGSAVVGSALAQVGGGIGAAGDVVRSGAGANQSEARKGLVYRATFSNDVKIVQGGAAGRGKTGTGNGTGASWATADQLQVDFSSGSRREESATAKPGGNPPEKPVPERPKPVREGALAGGEGQSGGVTKTTEKGEEVVLTWNGPLKVLGLGSAGDIKGGNGAGQVATEVPALAPGQSVARLYGRQGKPVELGSEEFRAVAGQVTYQTADRVAILSGGGNIGGGVGGVTLTDDRGSVVTTELLRYEMRARRAELSGASVVRAVADRDEQGRPREMVVRWVDKAELTFGGDETGSSNGRMGPIRHALLGGNVVVEHPELQLAAEKLGLEFDPEVKRKGSGKGNEPGSALAEESSLRRVVAEGKKGEQGGGLVRAVKLDEKGTPEGRLMGERLDVTMAVDARGKSYAKKIVSHGTVEATDGKQVLHSDELEIDLEPEIRAKAGGVAGAGAAKPQTLLARGHVRAVGEDGSKAEAATMTVTDASGRPRVVLEGKGTDWARVTGEGESAATVSGPRIVYSESEGIARIEGPGRMVGEQKPEKPGERPVPFAVDWAEGAVFDGVGNKLEVTGDVKFETVGADGELSTATGRELSVLLADRKQPGGGNGREKASSRGGSNVMSGKEPVGVELRGGVKLESVLADAGGMLLRQFSLLSERVKYLGGIGGVGNGAFEVPEPGYLVLLDRRAEPEPKAQTREMSPQGRGTTAMKWKESVNYRPQSRELTFRGTVQFAHQPLSKAEGPGGAGRPEEPLRLDADQMTAVMVESARSSGGSARPEEDFSQVERFSAMGNVVFKGRGFEVWAWEMEFNPTTQILVARGRDRADVVVDDMRGAGTMRAKSVRINLKSGQIEELQEPTGAVGVGALRNPPSRAAGGGTGTTRPATTAPDTTSEGTNVSPWRTTTSPSGATTLPSGQGEGASSTRPAPRSPQGIPSRRR